MNKLKRSRIQSAKALLTQASGIIDSVKDQEWDDYSNLPESLQESERGLQMEQACDALEEAIESIDEASECLDRACGE